jgi:hypothetical protein
MKRHSQIANRTYTITTLLEPKVEDVGPSGFICTQKQRENVLVSFTSLTHARHGKKTKEWDGIGAHSYTDGMDSPSAHKHKEKMC